MLNETVVFYAYGNENVLATHKTTLEITKEKTLTKRGNCILAVKSTKSVLDLPNNFKEVAKNDHAQIIINIEIDGIEEKIRAKGSSNLQLMHPTDLVVRKSNHICNRTLAINADKAAFDLSRELIEKLKNSNQIVKVTLNAKIH